MTPHEVFAQEATRIQSELGVGPLVSLTDHDDIQAGLDVRSQSPDSNAPASVEWTLPFGRTFFHLGLHNIAPPLAPRIMQELKAITSSPQREKVCAMLEWLNSFRDTLIVLNHPLWDESHIGAEAHRSEVEKLLAAFYPWIHALELNGLRPWRENQKVTALAEAQGLPVISGGDRHGCGLNACLNLTPETTFAGFAADIRERGASEVLFMNDYRLPHAVRIVRDVVDAMSPHPRHPLGRRHWSDRVFWRADCGRAVPFSAMLKERYPLWSSAFSLQNATGAQRG